MKRLAIIILFSLLLSACSQTAWMNNSFNTARNDFDSVTVIFPQIKYFEKLGEKQYLQRGKSIYVANSIATEMKNILESGKFIRCKGIVLTDSITIEKWLAKNFAPSLKDTLKSFDTLKVLDNNWILKFSDEMKDLTSHIKTKYIFYIKGIAFCTTENTKHGDMIQLQTFKLFYGNNYAFNYQWNGLQLDIYLADAKTGEVLWHNRNKDDDTKYEPLKANEINRLMTRILEID